MMKVLGFICIFIAAIFVIGWLYRRISLAGKYTKTTGEIIDFRNMLPLVGKTPVLIGGNYVYTECKYQGHAYVTVRFINGNGEELIRRYNSMEPLFLKINEHKRSVNQYTAIFPEWRMGKKLKIYYDPENTTDIFVGKAPSKKSA